MTGDLRCLRGLAAAVLLFDCAGLLVLGVDDEAPFLAASAAAFCLFLFFLSFGGGAEVDCCCCCCCVAITIEIRFTRVPASSRLRARSDIFELTQSCSGNAEVELLYLLRLLESFHSLAVLSHFLALSFYQTWDGLGQNPTVSLAACRFDDWAAALKLVTAVYSRA